MADDFGIEMVGDRKVALRFDKFPEELRQAFIAPTKAATKRIAGHVRTEVPTGEKADLPGLVIEQFFNDPDQVSGRVTFSDRFAKVGALEWGAPGKRNRNLVREHKAQLGHYWAHRLQRPITVMIAAHRRQLNVKQHRFLRNALADEGEDYVEALRAVVDAKADQDE